MCLRKPWDPARKLTQDSLSLCSMVAGPRPGGMVVGDIPMDERILRVDSLGWASGVLSLSHPLVTVFMILDGLSILQVPLPFS